VPILLEVRGERGSATGAKATTEVMNDQIDSQCLLASIDEQVPTLLKVLLCIALSAQSRTNL
jgi:hypothetical protein